MMSRVRFSALCVLQIILIWFVHGSAGALSTEDLSPAQEQRYHKLLRELRCLVCQNQSLAESDAGLATDLRAKVKAMLTEGSSDAEIFAFMTERYGDFVLYQPPFKSQNYVLWLAPFLLLIIGLAVLIRRVARQVHSAEPKAD